MAKGSCLRPALIYPVSVCADEPLDGRAKGLAYQACLLRPEPRSGEAFRRLGGRVGARGGTGAWSTPCLSGHATANSELAELFRQAVEQCTEDADALGGKP